MIRLSVNLNKIALLRNSRQTGVPDVMKFARLVLETGCEGITVHPRPDRRHILREDVFKLAELMQGHRPAVEFNLEGYPSPEFIALAQAVCPEQVTLVPDAPDAPTSDKGWDLDRAEQAWLRSVIKPLQARGMRVCLFMDPDPAAVARAPETGANGIEIYTGTFARAFRHNNYNKELMDCMQAASVACERTLIVNAGHDLNLQNLPHIAQLPGLREVSISHELTADALIMGWVPTLQAYRNVLANDHPAENELD